ncbi:MULTISPECIES: DUF177 domain-containing protein [environmental samples]|uniref:YceD family protein n=1 Tax=environmental samples TaxID=876090 RepID=UPI0003369A74|nr:MULTISPECIES: DUF177 domain-containing protein [environmental samples]CDC69114.1 putative uncharacterized protein [Oscillibacter sp. CAG:155]
MLFDVKPILYTPGKQLDFQFTLDLSDVEFSGRFPASHPIEVEGCVRNTADVLELELTARTTLDAVCDRCGKAFAQDKEVTYSCLLAQTLENGDSDEIVLLEDGKVDVGDLARTAFILGMDTKTLCSEDCKGLCPRCGADLNLGPCSCKKEADPRLAVLAKLLENK